jgi:two-component sensor histidine kinase
MPGQAEAVAQSVIDGGAKRMLETLGGLFSSEKYMPHGMCFLWQKEMLWLHVTSDAFIALAYYSIPVSLIWFITRRRDIEFRYMFLLFGIFILACGTTHLMGIWTIWNPDYGIDGTIKAITAVASIGTALLVWQIMPEALALPSPAQLRQANSALQQQVHERMRAEDTVRQLNADLERRVRERTADLEKANRELSQAVRDKEVLMMEVHHRVKNNLQVITSLLAMQARTMGDSGLTEAFNTGLNRIFTMARVHELLYQPEHAGTLDLKRYLEGLAQDLGRFHQSDGFRPELVVRVNRPLQLGLDKITPLALIVNEVLTNALRHGFQERRQGRIEIDLSVEADFARLEISDDGVGLRPDWPQKSKSLGLKLVELMARQIGGSFEIAARPEGGTKVVVRWPLHEMAEA